MKEYNESTEFGRLLIAARNKHKEIKTPADLARNLDVTQQKLTNWKRRGLPAREFDFLADKFGCNYKWLKTGEGAMHSRPTKFLSKDEMVRKEVDELLDTMNGLELLQAKSILEIVKSPKELHEDDKEKNKNKSNGNGSK